MLTLYQHNTEPILYQKLMLNLYQKLMLTRHQKLILTMDQKLMLMQRTWTSLTMLLSNRYVDKKVLWTENLHLAVLTLVPGSYKLQKSLK